MTGGKFWKINDELTGSVGLANFNSMTPMGFSFQKNEDENSLRFTINSLNWVKNNGSEINRLETNVAVPANSVKFYWLDSNNILRNGNSFPNTAGEFYALSKIYSNTLKITRIEQFNYPFTISPPETGGGGGNLIVIKTTITAALIETGVSTSVSVNPISNNSNNFIISLSRALLIPGFDYNYNSTTKVINYVSTNIIFEIGDVLIVRYLGV